MIITEELKDAWQTRMAFDPHWFARQYDEAVKRIEVLPFDHVEDPRWHSPANESEAASDGKVHDKMYGDESPEEARSRAFELLVLADLADVAGR